MQLNLSTNEIPFNSISKLYDPPVEYNSQIQLIAEGQITEANQFLLRLKSKTESTNEYCEWVKKTFITENSFTDDDFFKLDLRLKNQIYKVANIFLRYEMILRLNKLGMGQNSYIEGEMPYILSEKMDAVCVNHKIEKFLKDLNAKGLLLSREQFNVASESITLMDKGNDIGRILGRDYLEQTAKELNCTHVKVPRKIAVYDNDLKQISVGMTPRMMMEIFIKDLQIYAEKIEAVDRLLTQTEVAELVNVLEKTHFNDINAGNFIISKDDVYIIDTEFANIRDIYPDYTQIENLKNMMDPSLHQWFAELLKEKKQDYQNKEVEREEHQHSSSKEMDFNLDIHGFKVQRKPFIFTIEQILG